MKLTTTCADLQVNGPLHGKWVQLAKGRAQSPRDRTEAGAPAADPVLLSQNQNQERKGCSFQVFFSFFQVCLRSGFLFYLVSIYLFGCAGY